MNAILLLAVVDASGRFIYVQAGQPGSIGDAGCLSSSQLLANILSGEWLPAIAGREVNGRMVQPFLVGDAAFPLRPFLLKNIDGNHDPDSPEGCYNYHHIRTRRIVENAFGMLKSRFHICRKSSLCDPIFQSAVVLVCCALHNICSSLRDEVDAWSPDEDNETNPGNESTAAGDSASVDPHDLRLHLGEWCYDNLAY